MIEYMFNVQSPIAPIQIGHNKWYQQQIHVCNNIMTTQHSVFLSILISNCQWALRTFSDESYRIRNTMNNSNNNAISSCCASLTPHKQHCHFCGLFAWI